jgi:hypothetical protein
LLAALGLAGGLAAPGCSTSGAVAASGAGGAATTSSTDSTATSASSSAETGAATSSSSGTTTTTGTQQGPSGILFPDIGRPWAGVLVVRAKAPVAAWRIDSAALTPPSPSYPDPVLDTRLLADGPHTLSLDLAEGPKIKTYDHTIVVANGPAATPSFTGKLTDVSASAGLLFGDPANARDGAVAGDLDGDGDLDLFVFRLGGGRLYLQTAPMVFTPTGPFVGSINAAGLGDLDGDGLLDVVAVGLGLHILHNTGGALVDVTAESGVPPLPDRDFRGVTFADVDGDGLLDVAVGQFNCADIKGAPNLILRNEGAFHFSDIAATLGLGEPEAATFTVAIDVTDSDDLLHVWPFHEGCTSNNTRHYRFAPGPDLPTLVDAVEPVQIENPMGSALLDADGDGALDLWISGDTTSPLWTAPKLLESTAPYVGLDVHLDQQGHPIQGWSKVLFDADLDGRPDVLTVHENTHDPSDNGAPGHSTLFWQRAPGHFSDVASLAGLDAVPGCQTAQGVDIDGDGDSDLLLGCPGTLHLLRNDLVDPTSGRTIVLHGTMSNPDGVHALLTSPGGELRVSRGGGQPFAGGVSRESMRAPSGKLSVRWPSGITQLVDVGSAPVLHVIEPRAYTVTPRRIDAKTPGPVSVEVDPQKLGDAAALVEVTPSAGVWSKALVKEADGVWRGTLVTPPAPATVVLQIKIGATLLRTRPRIYVR